MNLGKGTRKQMKKRTKGGRLSDNQRDWIDRLREAGNRVEACKGFEEARRVLLDYLNS